MDKVALKYLIVMSSLLIMLLLLVTLSGSFKVTKEGNTIAHNQVRGMAIVCDGTPYTLNFKQQNEVVEALNKSENINDRLHFNAEKLIIYRFDASEMVYEL